MRNLLLVLFALLWGCPRTGPLEPPFVIVDARAPDGADGWTAACYRLQALGCPEARDVELCAATMAHAQAISDYAPACVASAVDPAGLRTCSPAWRQGCPGR